MTDKPIRFALSIPVGLIGAAFAMCALACAAVADWIAGK